MAFTIPPIAVSTTPDGTRVARFGHDFPLVAVDTAGVRTPRHAEGCCGNLAKLVLDCEVVICSAIGRGAAQHLEQAGVRLAVVAEGTAVDAAVAQYRAGTLSAGGKPSPCGHGHEHGHEHAHAAGSCCRT